ncbi:hypothetical protein [Acidovorax sp. NCPPB 3576]|uniref:hypothetical protein n=1 Tax=Acidovorax sp. NCPPB 3576 TaxID=2940488 RepID=UPI00234BBD93|nr:hypothetical protein [Acidovorax sp. NCPPB 3576]WCM86656.1 hypothetical protein M5C98_14845 [Acidovorax sp. NCPPB 3576]
MRENLKATKSFTYAGRALKAGDGFPASRGDARVLQAIGRAVPAETYQTAVATPEVTKTVSPSAPAQAANGGAKPSDGLKVADLKAALADRGIEIPEGVTLKADLAELLDAAFEKADDQ